MLSCQRSKGELGVLGSKVLARTFRPTMPQRESIESRGQFIILVCAMTLLAYNLHQMLYNHVVIFSTWNIVQLGKHKLGL